MCDRILTRINFNDGSEVIMNDQVKLEKETNRNLERNKIKIAITKCLMAFLEGVTEREAKHMLHQLDWHVIGKEMVSCFKIYEKDQNVDNRKKYVEEGMSYYLLLKHMRCYDKANQVIPPLLKTLEHSEPRCIGFFATRTGYIEIIRNGHLERVFLQLPEVCVESGYTGAAVLGDTIVNEMYIVEQLEDFDKKNKDWITNMGRIVDRHVFHTRIRNTYLAWTVTQWDLITRVNFIWILAMHFLLVFAGYMPTPLLASDAGMEQDYRERLEYYHSDPGNRRVASAAKTGVAEELAANPDPHEWSEFDEIFFDDVRPVVNQIVDVMSYVNLVTCGVRLFAFVWAQLPMIIEFALEGSDDDIDADVAKSRETPMAFLEFNEEEKASIFVDNTSAASAQLHLDSVSSGRQGGEGEGDGGAGGVNGSKALSKRPLWQRRFWAMVKSSAFKNEFCHTFFPIISVVTRNPLFSVYTLFEIMSWEGSKTVTDTIVINFGKLVRALILGLLLMYTWMVIGISIFRPLHDNDLCSNMFQCFLVYVGKAIRDNGVYEVLTEPNYPHNIVDALTGPDLFLYRFMFDMIYQIVFIYILLAMITGIVIDAFSEMQAQKVAKEENLESICFVCNVGRFRVDQDGIGFDRHSRLEHDPRMYLFFLVNVCEKSAENANVMTESERYIYEAMWPEEGKRSFHWLPREQTFTLKHTEDVE